LINLLDKHFFKSTTRCSQLESRGHRGMYSGTLFLQSIQNLFTERRVAAQNQSVDRRSSSNGQQQCWLSSDRICLAFLQTGSLFAV